MRSISAVVRKSLSLYTLLSHSLTRSCSRCLAVTAILARARARVRLRVVRRQIENLVFSHTQQTSPQKPANTFRDSFELSKCFLANDSATQAGLSATRAATLRLCIMLCPVAVWAWREGPRLKGLACTTFRKFEGLCPEEVYRRQPF